MTLKRWFAAWLIALAAMIISISAPVAAQPAQLSAAPPPNEAAYGDDNISVQLVAQSLPKPGEEWMIALRFNPSGPEWHGYWSNPGDAGQGMDLVLNLPPGWEAGKPLYPVPERMLQEIPGQPGIMNHIYKGEYAVLIPVKVPDGALVSGLPPVKAYVSFLACTDRVCVPQDSWLDLGLGGNFSRWQAKLAPLLDAKASFEIAGDIVRIGIPLPESVALNDPHVFMQVTNFVRYNAAQTFLRSGDVLVAEIPLSEYRHESDPRRLTGIVSFGAGVGVRFEADIGEVPSDGIMIAGPKEKVIPPLWTLIAGALLGGLILNIMPCVFPILSLKALSLARAGGDEATAKRDAIAYTAGVVIACVALGALLLGLRAAGQQVGWAFQLQEPSVVIVLLVLAAIITANFAGIFELPSFSFTQSGKPAGSFVTGLLAAFAATPCTGPFMAAALGAALLLPVPEALLLFAMLGLGLALPFLLVGFVPALRNRLPKPGAWMERFRRIMAIPMGLTTLALIWLTVQLGGRGFALFALVMLFGIIIGFWAVGRLQRAGKMAWPALGLVAAPFVIFGAFALPYSYAQHAREALQSIHNPQQFERDALAKARASGKPVFVWFTADWCVSCKLNEAVAIERESTREAFEKAGVITIVGDWTVRDEKITKFLTEHGAAGVPLYLWYPAGGGEPEIMPQLLTPDMLSERAEAAR
ncbi:MAG: thioredoxin family protein [Erythrobacter sp.]